MKTSLRAILAGLNPFNKAVTDQVCNAEPETAAELVEKRTDTIGFQQAFPELDGVPVYLDCVDALFFLRDSELAKSLMDFDSELMMLRGRCQQLEKDLATSEARGNGGHDTTLLDYLLARPDVMVCSADSGEGRFYWLSSVMGGEYQTGRHSTARLAIAAAIDGTDPMVGVQA